MVKEHKIDMKGLLIEIQELKVILMRAQKEKRRAGEKYTITKIILAKI